MARAVMMTQGVRRRPVARTAVWRVAAALAGAAAGPAFAATATDSFQVSATVAAACTVSAADLAFGSYDPLSATPASATSTISVRCTLDTGYSVGLDAGTGATVAARRMTLAANTLTYGLYQDAAHLNVWGDTPATNTVDGTGTGLAVPYTVYGQIPAGQNVPTGSYTDVITVSVIY